MVDDLYVFTKDTELLANYTPLQRNIVRHSSDEGSVVSFDMYGKPVQLFVADAKYRAYKQWSTHGINVESLESFTEDYKYINPTDKSDADTLALQYNLTDEEVQAKFPTFKTDKSARENTDALMTYDDTDAAHHCRSQIITGLGELDLPNIYEVIILYLESDRLDELDPTVVKYPQYALGKRNPHGRFDFNNASVVWSSTEGKGTYVRNVYYDGRVNDYLKYTAHGVVPVKEL